MTQKDYKKFNSKEDIELDAEKRNHSRNHNLIDYFFIVIKVLVGFFVFFSIIGVGYSFLYNKELFYEILFSTGKFLSGIVIGVLVSQRIIKNP